MALVIGDREGSHAGDGDDDDGLERRSLLECVAVER